MTQRIFNFSAGPATLPVEVLEEARGLLEETGQRSILFVDSKLRVGTRVVATASGIWKILGEK